MPLILEDESTKLGARQLTLPQNLVDHLRKQSQMYSGKEYAQNKGYKRLQSLLNKDYNNPSDKKDRQHNNQTTISFSDAKRIEHDIRHMSQSPNNIEYTMIGGDMMRDWVHSSLGSLRNSVHKVTPVPEVPKLDNKELKAPEVQKPIKVNGVDVTVESFSKQIKKLF